MERRRELMDLAHRLRSIDVAIAAILASQLERLAVAPGATEETVAALCGETRELIEMLQLPSRGA